MKIKSVTIHNFRSIKDGKFDFKDYTLLTGKNNVGKTNVMSALRIFYDNELKYSEKNDFPKFKTYDNESWIEISYKLTEEENENLKEEYKTTDCILKVRKYLKGDKVKSNQSNIYGYENGVLSENLFYGAKNISQGKLGNIIYIPDISKTDDTLKLSGPSPLRNIINFIMKKVITNSNAFKGLSTTFEEFNKEFKEESTEDGLSIDSFVNNVNENLKDWQIKFGLSINAIKPEDIVKNLITHYIQDDNLNGEKVSINSCGQGLQRNLIYTLIILSSKYVEKKENVKQDFSPDFTLILFEEPEAFLHPSQQENLNFGLKKLAGTKDTQILATTHSSIFINKNVEELTALCRIQKENGISNVFQLTNQDIQEMNDENLSIFKKFDDLVNDPSTEAGLKQEIRRRKLAVMPSDMSKKLEMESIKYMMWLDSERSSMFFAQVVLICEGATEKVFIDYLLDEKWSDLRNKGIYVLDAMGKFNIHRYMNIFEKLGIKHSIIIDSDENKGVQGVFNAYLEENKNEFTNKIFKFRKDIEDFLAIEKPCRKDLKPLNIMYKYKNNEISSDRINELQEEINNLI
ncbi:AAA family ATPase [Clostridium botulinum]|uniref:ATP-dependent endonuclease n=1 Tax=Clostridium botulinum TaxID=1491 RepID=A0A6B4JNE7_CLOBO|nr:AAA family ATPase [Clostridium botulinum]EES48539.1 conserved hypothetical protein [Clostridium botulinum E1 str. 'BoNT E Beluga']MBN1063899.1 ATP-dependent endonuclease [Clostridium botulinum]MBN1070135.1 ATP-dependent endonuclease [Clostridium botulinum]MBY6762210.1 AAA family ATPase [Clostridium botulinum]MBY6920477.1 AAA family ATPase [Clostridium botulinum]